ncbi:hypothetical protein [Bacillus cereus group sp. RP43]|uniref:hypothetical protein n=1 Tax=Bacillus cereus group sp. RP43 TaxID=3040260 RepID=UPI00339B6B4B
MPIEESQNTPWTRKHFISHAPKIVYPKSLEELIELCQNRPSGQRFKAAGSHWALSEAAVSDHTFIETNDPRDVHRAMGKTLTNVIPNCLNRDYIKHMVETEKEKKQKSYLVHVESGKRIYQLYAELDQIVDIGDKNTLAGFIIDQVDNKADYSGPWGFATLGGAGGQTIVGALNTGAHGGDFDRPPSLMQ